MCDESDYSASSCRLYRDYSNEDYSKLKIYKVCSSVYDKCYIGMCCNDLEDELKWIKDQYVYWTYGGGYVKKELYELICMGGDLSIVNIKSVCCDNKDECVIYLNEVLKLYIDNGSCVNKKLWKTGVDKLCDESRCELRTSNMGTNYEYKNNKLDEDKYKHDDRYKLGKIYKITSSNSELCYIGSTIQNLKSRLSSHVSNYKIYKDNVNNISYTSSYKILECGGEVDILLLEEVKCENKYELEKRESEYILKNISVCVNECVPDKSMLNEFNRLRGINKVRKEKIIKECKAGKLYKICSLNSDKYYIGSTNLDLDMCLELYKKEYEKYKYGVRNTERLVYEIIKLEDVSISLISEIGSSCNKELKLKEKNYIKMIKDTNCINIKISESK